MNILLECLDSIEYGTNDNSEVDMKWIAASIFFIAFLLLSPYFLQVRGMWYVNDDYDYFAHASSIAFGEYPSYKKEFFTIMKEGPQSPIGTGILAAPFVFCFSFIDRALGADIIHVRTFSSIVGSWSQFGFICASVFYFSAGVLLLFAGVSRYVPEVSTITVIAGVLVQGLPLFVFRRPFFSHCTEFFLQSVLIFLFMEFWSSKPNLTGEDGLLRKIILAPGVLMSIVFSTGCLLYLTRPNDLAYALIWPFLFMDFSLGWRKLLLQCRLGLVLFSALIFIFKFWPEAVNHYHPYSWALDFLKRDMSLNILWRRIFHVMVGKDWGLIFTAPFLVLSMAGVIFLPSKMFKRFIWLFIPLAVNFYVILAWGAQGGWYGYRYFIVSAIPIMILPLAYLLKHLIDQCRWRAYVLVGIMALAPFFSMACFETCKEFNLNLSYEDFNVLDWTNPTLQMNIWSTLIHHPLTFFSLIFTNVRSLIFSFKHPSSSLSWTTYLRVLIIYILPFLTLRIFQKLFKSR